MLSKAHDTLKKYEECLRGLVAEAAAAGKYDAVETTTEWARTLGRLRGGCDAENIPEEAEDGEQPVAGSASKRPSSSKSRAA